MRRLAAVLTLFGLAGILCGGSCYWRVSSGSCHHHDGCPHYHDSTAQKSGDLAAFLRLREFELATSEAGRVRTFTAIEGISLRSLLRRAPDRARELRRLCDLLVAVNEDLLLPPGYCGVARFAGSRPLGDGLRVTYILTSGVPVALDGWLQLTFDDRARLRAVSCQRGASPGRAPTGD